MQIANHRRGVRGLPFEARFWRRVDKTHPSGCWIWTGGKLKGGYGSVAHPDGGTRQAHRVAYELLVGPVPTGAKLRHECDTPECVNPDHLVPGTQGDNMNDASKRGRRWHKIQPLQAVQIAHEWEEGASIASLARKLGVTGGAIAKIVKGQSHAYHTGGKCKRHSLANIVSAAPNRGNIDRRVEEFA